MKDNKLFMIIVTVLAAIVLVLNIQKVISNNSQTDGIKFKEEYEKLNGKKNDQGKKYREITIDSKNKIVYKTTEEVLELIDKKKSFVLYFGFDTCPWCRSVVPTLASISKELNQEDAIRFNNSNLGMYANFIYDENKKLINKGKINQIILIDNKVDLKELDDVYKTIDIKLINEIKDDYNVKVDELSTFKKEIEK